MRRGIRIFGEFRGVSEEAFGKLDELLDFDEVGYDEGVVVIEHDGHYEGIEDVVLWVMDAMDDGFESNLDVIDHEENILTRFVIEADGFRSKQLNIDDVVQAYPNS
ncbi:uncharacterized protein DFE_1380 [Desulfovibrio ferrophilus]|uniref:Uncharacterized protein n=2 Tax=Desulfovibrio ferrophilus TaxID=241368 RepID=A0A2Z6AY80_9BACT|nr:uncharacterized protein DFE_1380 [Desulfovibrio ferrophilus]